MYVFTSSKNEEMTKYRLTAFGQTFDFSLEKVGEDDPIIIDPPPPPQPFTGFKVGANAFPWTPMKLFSSMGMKWARVYCASGWIWRPGGLFIQPMFQAETQEAHGIDDMLLSAKANGVTPVLCVHQCPEWYRPTGRGDGNNDYAPIPAGAKRDDPKSYKDYAGFLFQVAARYGRVKHNDNVLKVDTMPRWSGDIQNEKKTGLGLLEYIEPWNEEKWWKNGTPEQEAYIEPETMAALMSACYDGHEGNLGAGVGIKTADHSMVVVMPGLSDFAFDYASKMGDWFSKNRKDGKWPCDIINYHHYSNTGNKLKQYPPKWNENGACLPADDENFNSVRNIVYGANFAEKKVWITEMGADTVAPSMMLAKTPSKSSEDFQAEIITESLKAYQADGVDAVFVFTAHDDYGAADGGQFETCGLWTSQATGYKPKPSSEAVKKFIAASNVKAVAHIKNTPYI
jgi:hypothetical protein